MILNMIIVKNNMKLHVMQELSMKLKILSLMVIIIVNIFNKNKNSIKEMIIIQQHIIIIQQLNL